MTSEYFTRTYPFQYRSAPGDGRLFQGLEKVTDELGAWVMPALFLGGASGGGTSETRE